jgi:SSS family solute:Na+ symporter
LHRWALVAGWVAGMAYGLYLLYQIPNAAAGRLHFGGSALTLDKVTVFGLHLFDASKVQVYVGFVALVVNLLVAVIGTVLLRLTSASNGVDQTEQLDYHADEGSDRIKPPAVPAAIA